MVEVLQREWAQRGGTYDQLEQHMSGILYEYLLYILVVVSFPENM